ncbi:MAG: 30S ribosome-binding factor RbfA [bacterium]|nr:30S ribosome-binding factor RbfA [bacterium]
MSQRMHRVADLLRGELSSIIQHEMRDPRVKLATVSGVTVSRDLSHAEVRISVLGEDEKRQDCLRALERAQGYIRTLLAQRVRLRAVPEMVFKLDRGAEHSLRISEILEGIDVDAEGT